MATKKKTKEPPKRKLAPETYEKMISNLVQYRTDKGVVRKPSVVHHILVDTFGKDRYHQIHKLEKEEIDEIEQLALSCEVSDLKLLMQSDTTPIYLKGLISAIFTDMKNGTSRTLESLRERQYGAIAQKMELSGVNGAPVTSMNLTVQDAKSLIESINGSC